MRRQARREAKELFSQRQTVSASPIGASDLIGLPEPVQRYLGYADVVGRERVQTIRLKQRGFFRMQADQSWMPLSAEQYYTTDPPAFLWFGTIKPSRLLSISSRDMFAAGQGQMLIKLLSLVTLTEARGPQVDQGELARYLSEIVWFPTAWLSDYLQWQAVDAQSARVTLTHQDVTASAVLHFNEDGSIRELEAERYRQLNDQYVLDRWVTPLADYQVRDRFRIPIKGEAAWRLKSGDFTYFRGEVVEIEYNQPQPY
jgi:hypothetical protein